METKRKPNTILMAFGLICGLLAGTGTLPGCGKGEMDSSEKVAKASTDIDQDDIPDLQDNCINVSNPDQANNDGDQEGDACDPDDDNDGVADPVDNCQFIANLDQANPDRDEMGSACDPDDDNDEVVDAEDNCPGTWNPQQRNLDQDARGDACDRDCDGDGVPNFQEGQNESIQDCEQPIDLDGDGFAGQDDCREDNRLINIGAQEMCDGIDNDCDEAIDEGLVDCNPFPLPDSDEDGLPDVVDNCPLVSNEDQSDRDEDNIGDACDETPDGEEDCEDNEGCGPDMVCFEGDCREACNEELPCPEGQVCNMEGACVPDQGDNDWDDDTIPNGQDNCPNMPNQLQTDSDGDGSGDACDESPFPCEEDMDCDPDQECNLDTNQCVPLDTDNDGIPDAEDSCPMDVNEMEDSDDDGIDDACDDYDNTPCWEGGLNCGGFWADQLTCVPTSNPRRCVADLDNDEVPEQCPEDSLPGCMPDNCPNVANNQQVDSDGDLIGDACDNCPNNSNVDQADNDGDRVGNNCDNCPNVANANQADSDRDSIGDACDDSDGDGTIDSMDCSPNNPDRHPGAVEICDNVDDDCDEAIDENVSRSCYTGPNGTSGVGICHDGTETCAQGAFGACQGEVVPAAELCNGLDDDCDSSTDEEFNVGAPCQNGQGACLSNGVLVCAQNGLGATCDAPVIPPVNETCNNIDDNCNGQTDEDIPNGAACNVGVGACQRAGVMTCQNGAMACNAVAGQPAAELCNGLDDDCDGSVDEGNPGGGAACNTGLQGICAQGTQTCQNGAIQCVQNMQPAAEICGNAIDEDCNGADLACQQAPDLRGRMNNGESGLLSHPDGTPDNFDNDGDCYCETAPCVGSANPACGPLQGNDCDETCDNQGGNPLTGTCSGFGNNPNAGDWNQDWFDNNCDGVIKCLDNSFCMNGNQCINGTCQMPPQ